MSDLTHHPLIPMARFGEVPVHYGGGPRYRVIWAPSRKLTMVGDRGPMTVQMYSGAQAIHRVGEYWILERWLAPNECTTLTEEQWNLDPKQLLTGPYPGRGEWYHCETFVISPSVGMVEKLISWIEAGRNRRPVENALAIERNVAADAKARRNERDARMRNRMLESGGEAISGYGGGRGTKTVNLDRTAQEAGLPAPGVTKARPTKLGYKMVTDEQGNVSPGK